MKKIYHGIFTFLENLTHALENIWLSKNKYSIQKEAAIAQVFEDNINYSDLFYSGRFDFVVYERIGKQAFAIMNYFMILHTFQMIRR